MRLLPAASVELSRAVTSPAALAALRDFMTRELPKPEDYRAGPQFHDYQATDPFSNATFYYPPKVKTTDDDPDAFRDK